MDQHEGQVPDTFEALELLPGVGHKTASVVLAVAFKCVSSCVCAPKKPVNVVVNSLSLPANLRRQGTPAPPAICRRMPIKLDETFIFPRGVAFLFSGTPTFVAYMAASGLAASSSRLEIGPAHGPLFVDYLAAFVLS